MRRLLSGAVLSLCLVLYAFTNQCIAQVKEPSLAWPEFQHWLTDHLNQPRFNRALWGVKIVSLDTGGTVFSHQDQKLLSPASNSKLYTVALALDTLGPDYRIKT